MSTLDQQYNAPEDTHIQLQHMHPGNSSRKQRKGSKYVTSVKLVDALDYNVTLQTATATCSKRDTPNRKIGRDIAIHRVLLKHFEGLIHE